MSRSRPPAAAPAKSRSLLVPAAILLVAIALLVVSIMVTGGDDDGGSESAPDVTEEAGQGGTEGQDGAGGQDGDAPAEVVAPEAPTTLDMARRAAQAPLAVGPVDAPVTLLVYSDYQCPFCASWATDTGPVMTEYAEDGDLRIEYRDIAVFGEDSYRAALGAYAAGLQGRYLDFHQALFPEGETLPTGSLTESALIDLAAEIGLDAERFATDLGSPEVAQGVQRNMDEADEIGAFSTPAFLLAERPILGAQPTEIFVDAVDTALQDAA